jgi:uncharacterized protein (TIGR02453 family)
MDLHVVLSFLRLLAKNNNREWFEKNKSKYLDAKQIFDLCIKSFLNELVKFDNSLTGVDSRKLAFRIYRDVRFSKDKRPYKTNMGAGFSPNGKLVQEPGYYLHIEPGNKSMIAGGIYMPDSANLGKIRQEIDYNAEKLEGILKNKQFKSRLGTFEDSDKLKNVPKGFAKDHPYADWLKLKSYIVVHPLSDKEIMEQGFIKKITVVAKTIMPLNRFLKEALQ